MSRFEGAETLTYVRGTASQSASGAFLIFVLIQIRGGDIRRGVTIVKDNEQRVTEDYTGHSS